MPKAQPKVLKPDWSKVPKPTAKFKVRLMPKGSRFWDVKIFDSAKEMYAYQKALGSKLKENYAAITVGLERIIVPPKGSKKKGGLDKDYMGEILFYERSLTAQIIAHEACHAVLFTLEREGVKRVPTRNKSDHERFCDLVGNVTDGIMHGADKHVGHVCDN